MRKAARAGPATHDNRLCLLYAEGMGMKPLISVIVPVYNGQDFLFNCIKSIQAQTYPNLEVVIINDGSTDQTAAVCENIVFKYDNIRLISLEGKGVSSARNAGMAAAKGVYIAFVDADDRLLPKTLELLYKTLLETDADIAGCGFECWYTERQWDQTVAREAGEEAEKDIKEDIYRIYSGKTFVCEEILKGNSRCWSKLYKRDLIGDICFRQGLTIGEDMLFLVDLMPGVKKVVEIPYKGYGYYQNPAGAMNRAFRPQYMDQITCWEMAREIIDGMWKTPLKGEARDKEALIKKTLNGETADKETQIKEALGEEMSAGQVRAQVTAILIMGIMLTAGKLAMLSQKERRLQAAHVEKCHAILKRELQVPGAYERLSAGYRVKVKIFGAFPGVYLWLYHFRNKIRGCFK